MIRSITGMILSAFVLCAGPATAAPDILIAGGHDVVIPDGDLAPNAAKTTAFGPVQISDSGSPSIKIWNTGDQDLTLSDATIGGIDPGEFYVGLVAFAPPIPPGEFYNLQLAFIPTSAGSKSAVITVTSNDPDSESSYTFLCTGIGTTDPPPDSPDVFAMLNENSKNPFPVAKVKQKTGEVTVKWKFLVANDSDVGSDQGELVRVFLSPDHFYDATDQFLFEKRVKRLKPRSLDGDFAVKPVSIKANVGTLTQGYLVVEVTPLPEGTAEYKDNVPSRNVFFSVNPL